LSILKNATRASLIATLGALFLTTTGCVTSGKYDELDAAYQASQKSLASANSRINSLEGDLSSESENLAALQGNLSEKERALAELRDRQRQAAARIARFQELTDKVKSLVDAGKLKIAMVRGRMVVQMQTDVLFGSGSARLSREGLSLKHISEPTRPY